MKSDIVVVGSGAGALTAALSAATLGASVTVLERAPVVGGTSAISGGGLWLPCNPLAAEIGVSDSPEEAFDYMVAITLGRGSEPLLSAYAQRSREVYDFFEAETPLSFEVSRMPDYHGRMPGAKNSGGRTLRPYLYDTNRLGDWAAVLRQAHRTAGSRPLHGDDEFYFGRYEPAKVEERYAKGIAGGGRALVGGLLEACLGRGVTVIASCRARSLVMDGRRVSGVQAEKDGETVSFEANRGVVLASGGFEWDAELWDRMMSVPLDAPLSPPFNEGDGLRMALQAGAMVGNLNQAWWRPSLAIPGETYDGQPHLRGGHRGTKPGAIVVNRSGRRFANEALPYDDFGKAMVAFDPNAYTFPNHPCFMVFGRNYRERYPNVMSRFTDEAQTSSATEWLFEARNLRELAEKIGVDSAGLEAQVQDFDANAALSVDPVFGRGETPIEWWSGDSAFNNPNIAPVGDGPYYAYELKAAVFGTKGGAVIDDCGRVVGHDGSPVPGLFATGNVTAGIFRESYPGGGGTLGPAVVFGYIGGRTAISDG